MINNLKKYIKMPTINFTEVFKEIESNYDYYLNLPKIYGSITQEVPSLIERKDGDKWVKKIYNLANGIIYLSVKMYNVCYTIEMWDKDRIYNFHLIVYEDEDCEKIKFSVGAVPKTKKRFDSYGQYDHRYLTLRYLSDNCNFDIDDIRINEQLLINFLNSVGSGTFVSLFNKMFYN